MISKSKGKKTAGISKCHDYIKICKRMNWKEKT